MLPRFPRIPICAIGSHMPTKGEFWQAKRDELKIPKLTRIPPFSVLPLRSHIENRLSGGRKFANRASVKQLTQTGYETVKQTYVLGAARWSVLT